MRKCVKLLCRHAEQAATQPLGDSHMSSATCDKNKNGHNVRMIRVAVACWHASRRAVCMVTLIGQHSETKLGLIPTAPKEAVFQRRLLQCHRPLQAGIRYLGAEVIDTLPHGHNTCYTWQCPNTLAAARLLL